MKEGWICPRCGKVNAPFIASCDCNPSVVNNTCCGGDHDWRLISSTKGVGYTYGCFKCGATKDVYDGHI